MNLSGEVYNKLAWDSIIYFVFIIIATLYVKRKCYKRERVYLYLYIIITFSSFNIFIKPVQDYLIPIPRTFIFYYKVFGGVSIYDVCLILSFLFIIFRIILNHSKLYYFLTNNILTLLFKCDILVLVVSIIGFLLYYYGENPCDLTTQLRLIRNLLNAVVVVYVILKFIRRYNRIRSCKHLLLVLCTLNLLNFISQFISSLVLQGISWERGGHSVVLLDQTEGMLAMLYLPFLLVSAKKIPSQVVFVSWFSFAMILLNYIKAAYLNVAVAIILVFVIGVWRNRINARVIFLTPIVCFAIIVFSYHFFHTSGGDHLSRVGQVESFTKTIDNRIIYYITGIGNGGMILRQNRASDDGGEIRAIDLDKNTKYQTAFQIPVLSLIKISGFLGITIAFSVFLMLIYRSSIIIKTHYLFAIQYISYAVVTFFGGSLLSSDPQGAIFVGEFYMFIVLTQNIVNTRRQICRRAVLHAQINKILVNQSAQERNDSH